MIECSTHNFILVEEQNATYDKEYDIFGNLLSIKRTNIFYKEYLQCQKCGKELKNDH